MSDEILNSEELSDGMKACRAAFRNAMELAWKYRIAYAVVLCECHVADDETADMIMGGSCMVPTESEAQHMLSDLTKQVFKQGYAISHRIDPELSRDEIYDECVKHTRAAWEEEWEEENRRRGLD